MKKKRFVIIDKDSSLFSKGNVGRVWLFIGIPILILMTLYQNLIDDPKQKEEKKAHRDSFIQNVSYKDVVIGKDEKLYLVEYKDTFINEFDSYLYKVVEKGDTVIKEKGEAFYTVIRQDSVFKVGV